MGSPLPRAGEGMEDLSTIAALVLLKGREYYISISIYVLVRLLSNLLGLASIRAGGVLRFDLIQDQFTLCAIGFQWHLVMIVLIHKLAQLL